MRERSEGIDQLRFGKRSVESVLDKTAVWMKSRGRESRSDNENHVERRYLENKITKSEKERKKLLHLHIQADLQKQNNNRALLTFNTAHHTRRPKSTPTSQSSCHRTMAHIEPELVSCPLPAQRTSQTPLRSRSQGQQSQ
jgi:hypothetical protein